MAAQGENLIIPILEMGRARLSVISGLAQDPQLARGRAGI